MGVVNPVREEDLTISDVYFVNDVGMDTGHVEATEMNRAGRLFVQFLHQSLKEYNRKSYYLWARSPELSAGDLEYEAIVMNDALKFLIELHFAELYDDASEKRRQLIVGLRDATVLGIVFKPKE